MNDWLGSAVARGETVSDWLSPKRQASLALLREAQWPTRKTEAWKYTPLRVLAETRFKSEINAPSGLLNNKQVATKVDIKEVDTVNANGVKAIAGLNSIDLIFIDGVLQGNLTVENLPAGLSIVSLADAPAAMQNWAAETFTAIKPTRHLFGLVNDVLATSGLIIDVAAGVTIERPLRIINYLSRGQEAHTRVLVRLGAAAKATVIEHYTGNETSFNTGVSEYELAVAAELEHYRFALQTGEALTVGGSHFKLGGKAQLNSTLVGFGSDLSRLDVAVTHAGEYAIAKLNAIFLVDGSELIDLHSTIEHAVPHGTTEEKVWGIVAGNARAVFNGRIHIHRDAQKTLAELNNRNLLLSANAEINTKPELEIYADDVRCTHGATVAQLDKQALYYLQTRGVSKAQAQIMLSFGFINALVDQMPNQVLAQWLRPQLRQRFVQMEVK